MKAPLLTIAVVLTVLGRASADQTIYQDSFAGGSSSLSVLLNGTTPTIDTGGNGGTPGATWAAPSQWVTNGSVATAFTQTANAYLPFTPETGQIYTLSASLGNTSDQWTALGFTQYAPANTPFWSPDAFPNTDEPNASPFVVLMGSDFNNGVEAFGGPGYINPGGSGTGTQEGTYTMTLNTESTLWTYSVTGPGISTGNLAFTVNPTINYVGFGSWSPDSVETGTVDHFILKTTSTSPEPSTCLLFGLGGLALLVLYRCRAFRMV